MTRLDYIEVEGYKSIRQARVEFGAINVLIGANGAGKSNLVSVFGLLGALVDRRLQLHVGRAGGADAMLHFGGKRTPLLKVLVAFGDHQYRAMLEMAPGDSLRFNDEKIWSKSIGSVAGIEGPVRESLGRPGMTETALFEPAFFVGESPVRAPAAREMQRWRVFHFHDTGRSSPIKQKHDLNDNRALRPDGDNLAAFLYAMRATAPGAYKRVVEAVRSVAPFFEDFVLEPDKLNPDRILLEWRHRSDDGYWGAQSLSDGTLRFACLATLLLQPEPPSLIVIDEPELGLHPFAIEKLAALIRSVGDKAQVLLATQSVTLLEQFEPEEVIVVDRQGDESTFRRLDREALESWLADYSLGELWTKNVLNAVHPAP